MIDSQIFRIRIGIFDRKYRKTEKRACPRKPKKNIKTKNIKKKPVKKDVIIFQKHLRGEVSKHRKKEKRACPRKTKKKYKNTKY